MTKKEQERIKAFEETIERLRKKGFMNGWNKPPRPNEQINLSSMPSLQKTAKALEQLERLLNEEVKKDQDKIDDLKEKVERLKHGGGV